MSALNDLTQNLVHVALQLCSFIMLLRLLLQWVQADFFNPLSQSIFRITAPLVEPLHRFFPTFGTFNTAALIGAFVFKWIYVCILIFTGQRLFNELPSYLLISIYEIFVREKFRLPRINPFFLSSFTDIHYPWLDILHKKAVNVEIEKNI